MHDVEVRTEPTTEIERAYRRMGAKPWRALLAYSADPEVAADAVAEAFAQALAVGDAIRDVERWVWRAAFKVAAGEFQRRRRSPDWAPPEQTQRSRFRRGS
jgi:DNA-directed RNA polymerase specialized sigma24 family protein